MRKNLFMAAVAAFSLALVGGIEARAQSGEPRVEVGGQFAFIHFRDLSSNDAGFGGHITYHLNTFIAIEGELNVFPGDKNSIDFFSGLSQGGRKVEGLVGVLTGFRGDKFGIYGKFRPGFLHLGRDLAGDKNGNTDFAMDVGAVVEYYPTRHTFLRLDLGDTIVRFPGSTVNVGGTLFSIPAAYSNNLQVNIGGGVRF
jgi:hypothetical protein